MTHSHTFSDLQGPNHPYKDLETPLIHDTSLVTEKDAIDIMYLKRKIYQHAVGEVGRLEYAQHIRTLFGRPVLDYAKTLIINLPESCYCNCSYCIDKDLRKHHVNTNEFLQTCDTVLTEKHDFNEVSITGGTLPSDKFNQLVSMIQTYMPDVKITWNTNGVNIDNTYDISHIKYINLHRNSADDTENKNVFGCNKPIISIEEFKAFAGNKLCIRMTVDEHFDINDYAMYNTPMYLNRLIPGTPESEKSFDKMLASVDITEDSDIRRRNHYLNGLYKNIPVRLCIGDRLARHVPGRYPMWLNVVIIHRSGIVSGSWYEDDKFLYKKS